MKGNLSWRDKSKYCQFHQDHGCITDKCLTLFCASLGTGCIESWSTMKVHRTFRSPLFLTRWTSQVRMGFFSSLLSLEWWALLPTILTTPIFIKNTIKNSIIIVTINKYHYFWPKHWYLFALLSNLLLDYIYIIFKIIKLKNNSRRFCPRCR